MTLGKFFACCLCAFTVMGCSNSNDDEPQIGADQGYCLVYHCRPCEELQSYRENNHPDLLHLIVTSSLREAFGYRDPQRYTIEGDRDIETQIGRLLDPDNELKGMIPIQVEYRTVPCKAIYVTMYDADGNFVSDITDQAHFHNLWEEDAYAILINSSREVLGVLKDGITIKEYLEYHPMVFAQTWLSFDDLNMEVLEEGGYLKTEIELEDGTILVSDSREQVLY